MSTPSMPERTPLTARGQATRSRILASAEKEFGERGFHAASVSSITQDADVGQGTFYLYFHTKEEIFSHLVGRITEQLAEQLARAGAARAAIETLLQHCVAAPGQDRILREAEFVDGAAWRESRQRLVEALAARLDSRSPRLKAAELLGGLSLVAQQAAGATVDISTL